ncbi:choline dehydrogenase-like flavoprotein [Salinibacter ruber]|uniref:FAD-dependent oxidoreductase n=1 Tax=Salinibacter ruber TaxID=146919 RepID=UPI00160EA8EA|nr:GMC family oxidoreductase [Salinibacter ruber]MBB4070369.1 choline dehydrogenase-like flavoprotein [Salinibacter ruber]
MHLDARDIEQGHTLGCDVCLVGAGAAGITIARKLTGSSVEVCLLEQGGLEPSREADTGPAIQNEGLPYRSLPAAEDRRFGGATNRWGGLCAPFDPIDFEKRPWVLNSGWPLDRNSLDPYYAEAKEVLQLGPYRYDADYWTEAVDEYRPFFNGSSRLVDHVVQFSNSQFSRNGQADSPQEATRLGVRYRNELLEAQNVTVVTHATVTELQTPPSAATVSGLKVCNPEGTPFHAEAERYVLAAGGIETPRLLLLSDRYAPNGLGNQQDLVGRFFMESPHVPSASVTLSSPRRLNAYRQDFSQYRSPLFQLGVDAETQREEEILNGYLRLDTRSSGIRSLQSLWRRVRGQTGEAPDVIRELKSLWDDPVGVAHGLRKTIQNEGPAAHRFGRLNVLTIAEQSPNPHSRVTLSQERDAFGRRKASLNWQLSELDRRSVIRLNQLFDRELHEKGQGRLRLADWLGETAEWRPDWPAEPSRYWTVREPSRFWGVRHYMGTTRMGSTPQSGVCDVNGKVYGTDNLYVAGSSTFPTTGGAPPTLTIVALALRLADHLRSEISQI